MAAKGIANQMSRMVRVNRVKLIETIRANRAKHIANFTAAMAGYKEMATAKIQEAFKGLQEKLDRRRVELENDLKTFSPETADRFSDHMVILNAITVSLTVPVSYEEAYDTAIDMATFDTRDELELSGAEFQCFCRDVWDWSTDFTRTTAMYAK